MKTKIIIALLAILSLGAVVWWKQGNKVSLPVSITNEVSDSKTADITAIRTFMANSNLELSFVKADLPMPYFRVGKVTKTKDGENMEAVGSWLRKVNVYDKKGLIDGQYSVYEYHTDVRNHQLTAVLIRDLRPEEVEALREKGTPCLSADPAYNAPAMTKEEAQGIAFAYLKRALPNFEEIKSQFIYTLSDKSHQWAWEDKSYQLPEGLEGRLYSYPTIIMSVYEGDKIQYWNTVPLFED